MSEVKSVKKIGNFVIVNDLIDLDNNFSSRSTYERFTVKEGEEQVPYYMIKNPEGKKFTIAVSDIANWTTDGATPFSEETFLAFLRANLGS